jgi:phosphatidylethanolamine/phosphatidyl-N-methylethanolamine N-methyltransferase
MTHEKITVNDVKKTYHYYAPIYDILFGSILESGRIALVKEVLIKEPSSLLEIGVGTGLLIPHYPISCKITGIDISDDMLEIAKKRILQLPNQAIELINMDAEKPAFGDSSFDCVVLPYVLSVTPNPHQLITEARRVCKDNGHIIIVNHFSGNRFWWFLEKLFKNLAEKIGFRSQFSYQEHIESHNWQIEKVKSVNLFGLSKLIVIRNIK